MNRNIKIHILRNILLAIFFSFSGNLFGQTVYSELAKSYAAQGDFAKAIEIEKEGLEMCERVKGTNNLSYIIALNYLASYHANIGQFIEAYTIQSKVVELSKNTIEINNLYYGWFLKNLAEYSHKLGNNAEAINFGIEATETIKVEGGEDSEYYIHSLNKLASYYSASGRYKEAIECNSEVVDLCRKRLGNRHSEYANALTYLAEDYYLNGNFVEAIIKIEEALDILQEDKSVCPTDYLKHLSNRASYYANNGNYMEAVQYEIEVLDECEKIYGQQHPEYAHNLFNLASYYNIAGDYSKGLNLGMQALEILQNLQDTFNIDYAIGLSNVANSYSGLGQNFEAIDMESESLRIRKAILGSDHHRYAESLGNLSRLYFSVGNYNEAAKLGSLALQVQKETLGSKHMHYGSTLFNQALALCMLGNYPEAVKLGTESADIIRETLGDNHPSYAMSLVNLSSINIYNRDYFTALDLLNKGIDILKQVYGLHHRESLLALGSLGVIFSYFGRYQDAINVYREVADIQKVSFGEKHPDYALALHNLAATCTLIEDYAEALKYGEISHNIFQDVYGPKHPYTIGAEFTLFFNYFTTGEIDAAKYHLERACNNLLRTIKGNFVYLGSDDRHLFLNKYLKNLRQVFKYECKYEDLNFQSTGYNVLLFSKGCLLNSELEFSKFLNTSSQAELVAKYNELRKIKLQLNKLYERPIKARIIDTDSLERHASELERNLMYESAEFGDYTRNISLKWEDVRDKLEEKDAAIEFVSVLLNSDSTMYMAYVLRKDMKIPLVVRLFEEKDLLYIEDKEGGLYEANTASKIIWEKLDPYIKDVTDIYFAPDGILHQIAIEHFPDYDGDGMLSDRFNLHRLSSTREIALDRNTTTSKDAVIYGGIKYSSGIESMQEENKKYNLSDTRGFQPYYNLADTLGLRKGVAFLTFTQKEADAVNGLMQDRGYQSSVISGEIATEESFKNLSGKKNSIIHVSTHGFFWEKDEADRKATLNDRLLFMGQSDEFSRRSEEDKALTRSGLLMAGANNVLTGKEIPEDIDDGLLTAQEIANLDLRDLDLVVLSACQTGMGEISGDGVFGLQRGFKKAGAKSILMSLWDVDDEATQILMTEFYRNYLDGMSKSESLSAAQKTLRKTPGFERPEYWAAFILLDGLN